MDALEQARAEIDEVDAQLAALFERRMAAVLQVAEYKRVHGLPIFDAAREAAVLEKAAANMTADIPDCMIAEEVDRQMERFGYQLQMNGMSLKQYSEMMGGNLDALRDSMKGMAEAKVKQMVLLDAVAEAEKVEVTADDIAEEYKKLADSYKMDEEKVKQMLSEDDIKGNLESRKAAKLIVDAAVAVAPVEEKAEEAAESKDAE